MLRFVVALLAVVAAAVPAASSAAEFPSRPVRLVLGTPAGSGADLMLRAISDEAHKRGLRMITHNTAVVDAVMAADAGTDYFAHTPHIGWVDEGDAIQKIVAAGAPMVTTLGVFTPYFDDTHHDGLFRDNNEFQWDALHSAGQGPVNDRFLWNAGVVIGYGTDTSFAPRDSLRHELRALSSVFGPKELVTIMTKNAAICADVDEITGTIETGKQADLALVDPERAWVVDSAKMSARAGNTPFDRLGVQGRVTALYKGGVRIAD